MKRGVFVQRPVVHLAAETGGTRRSGPASVALRELHSESLIRSRIRSAAIAFINSPVLDVAGDDGGAAAWTRHADVVPGRGIRGVGAVPLFAATIIPSWQSWSRPDGGLSSNNFPAPPARKRGNTFPIRSGKRRSSVASWIFPSGETHAEFYELHRDLLKLRHDDPVFRQPQIGGVDGAVLGPEAFVLRFFGNHGDDRLVLVNLGIDLRLNYLPEPLLAPVEGKVWKLKWSSEDPRYGGGGTPPLEVKGAWNIPGHARWSCSPEGKS